MKTTSGEQIPRTNTLARSSHCPTVYNDFTNEKNVLLYTTLVKLLKHHSHWCP